MLKFPVLRIENVEKNFGPICALKGVSLSLNKGEIYALIGPNGSGKTTLLKIIVGLLKPDKGKVSIFGYEIEKQEVEAKKNFFYISDNPSAYEYLTGKEFLLLNASLRGIEEKNLPEKIANLLKIFPLTETIDQPMNQYSRGNKQKIAFLAALLSCAPLFIIDEPIVGLDPTSIEIFGRTLKKFTRNGGSVLFATHTLSFAEKYAQKVGFLDKGLLKEEIKIIHPISLEKIYREKTEKWKSS